MFYILYTPSRVDIICDALNFQFFSFEIEIYYKFPMLYPVYEYAGGRPCARVAMGPS